MKIDFNADKVRISRALILIVIPFLLGALVLQHTETMTEESLLRPAEIQTSYLQYEAYEFSHQVSLTDSQMQVSTLFPLANYVRFWPAVSFNNFQLCFQDTGSNITYLNGTTVSPSFEWAVHINNRTTVRVPPDSISCIDAKTNESYSFSWVANLPLSVLGSINETKPIFAPSIVVYPKVTMDYGILQGLVFIPVFYLLIFYPIAGIHKKIEKGLLEQ